jgi:membrane protease subunit HflK
MTTPPNISIASQRRGSGLPAAAHEQAYRRGRAAAIAGLVIQVGLAVGMGLAGVWAESPAVHAATWHLVGGLAIWIVLALIYQQHEAERAETLASEKIATSNASAAAIFGDVGDELLVARTRLQRLYDYGLPIVSFLLAAFLVVVGLVLTLASLRRDVVAAPAISPNCQPVALLFAMGGMAFTAFIAARWISGYTRTPQWQLLRGGASYLMSSFLLGGLLFLGAVVAAIVEDTSLFSWLALAVPMFMVLVGGEILLTSLLSAYRPRRPGEIPRPAFDSRVLGLLTAPESLGRVIGELVNYQFGVEISKSWFYELLGKAFTPLTIFAGAVLMALSCIVIVGPDERGVLLRCGAMREGTVAPGIHFKLPWPIETATVLPVGRVHQLLVSTDLTGRDRSADPLLWTTANDSDAAAGQEFYVTAPGDQGGDFRTAGGGMALVAADVVVQYRVADIRTFLLGSLEFMDIVRAAAQREASQFFARTDIDSLLGMDRTLTGDELRRSVQARLDTMALGIEVVSVAITALHPPKGKVSRGFHNQIGAVQERETLIQAARTDAIIMLTEVAGSVDRARLIDQAIMELDALRADRRPDPSSLLAKEQRIESLLADALGQAAELVHAARSYRWRRTVGEQASQEQFAGELLAYEQSPAYYQTRKFLQVLSEGLAPRRKYIVANGGEANASLQMDFNDPVSAMDTLLSE